jgi:hypothetical protein
MEGLAPSHRWSEYRTVCEDFDVDYNDSSEYDCCDQLKNEIWGCGDDVSVESSVACDFPDELATVGKSERELFLRICNRSGEIMMEGFFPLRPLKGGRRDGNCLDLSSAHCQNWPEMESFLSRELSERDEQAEMWEGRLSGFDTVTLIRLTKYNAPRLVASVDEWFGPEIEYGEEVPEDDPWYPTYKGGNPMRPHYFQSVVPLKVKSRAVEFGWCKNRRVVGFCLFDTEHTCELPDYDDCFHSP